jgi:type II secretory pathway component GspD/PulD (secretin)
MKKNMFKQSHSRQAILACALGLGFAAVPALRAQNNTFQPGVSAIIPYTQQVEIGPILDVVPYVLSDGYTINLTLIPSLTDFNGYDTPPSIANVTGSLNVVQLPVILPDFSIRQVVATVNVWDNQTVVIGGLISSQVSSTSDKVPVLGDIPLVGNLFQSNSKSTIKKNLMIFVTATIVDPAGNRVHSDDELPFAQNAIPEQPPGASTPEETVSQTHSVPAVQ